MSGQCQIILFNYLYFPDLGVLSFANTFLLIQRMSSDVKRETMVNGAIDPDLM